ncbi:MAG: hypothetical protein AAF135_10715 [Bacteroidota bacterium]
MSHTATSTNRVYRALVQLDTHVKINSDSPCADQLKTYMEEQGYSIQKVLVDNRETGKYNFEFEAPSKKIKSIKNGLNGLPCVESYTILKVKG